MIILENAAFLSFLLRLLAHVRPLTFSARACGGMKGMAWLIEQNAGRAAKRRAEGKSTRQRGGNGREVARQRWALQRSLMRAAARRRREVVGRVRLHGKGPPPRLGPIPPRLGPILERQSTAASSPTHAPATAAQSPCTSDQSCPRSLQCQSPEPLDTPMLDMLGLSLASDAIANDKRLFHCLVAQCGTKP